MTDIQKYPGFVLRDMWIDGALSDEDYSAEIARRVKIKMDKDALIRELVAALDFVVNFRASWTVTGVIVAADEQYPDVAKAMAALAKAKAAGYSV